jgi:hypothetical protein
LCERFDDIRLWKPASLSGKESFDPRAKTRPIGRRQIELAAEINLKKSHSRLTA